MKYPRILVVALDRINAADSSNNGLLLRNLFALWPRETLAQIYSSGDNGDRGAFGHYYQLGPMDRQLGKLFYRIKKNANDKITIDDTINKHVTTKRRKTITIGFRLKRLLVDSGLYELIFRPRLSQGILEWVKDFQPDIIFAQGYNLTFTWLPILLKNSTAAKLAFLTTDDWPTYLYSGQLGEPVLFRWLVRPVVEAAIRRLFYAVDIPFAFGQPMAEEYAFRYGKTFFTLNHADSSLRFENAEPCRIHPTKVITIIAIGNFNRFRWPLVLDFNDACHELHEQGIDVRIVVLTSSIDPEGARAFSTASYIDVLPDPGNDLLPSYLKGADILLLAEGFDEGFISAIQLSISSKSHLFMFSQRPIIVYSHSKSGIAKYAEKLGWGKNVFNRNKREIVEAIKQLIVNKEEIGRLVTIAYDVAEKNHSHKINQEVLLKGLTQSET
jgi:glycosyltransferase involved in cell wall biosynthesis